MDYWSIINHMLHFIIMLYGDPTFPRKIVDVVINYIHNFLKHVYLLSLKKDITDILKCHNINDTAALNKINECFNDYSNIFMHLLSEHNRFNILQSKGMIAFEEFKMGSVIEQRIVNNVEKLICLDLYGICVPLRNSLKMFLEIPNLFNEIMKYMDTLKHETEIVTNIIQGSLWKVKYAQQFANDIVFPLYLFYDELEVGNALGSHAGKNKFGAIYASIACLPRCISSRLQSIIFSTLVYAGDKKKSTNRQTFKTLIDELNFLSSEGILIKINGTVKKIKFQLMLIIGDNLGLNQVLGFVESFKANYFCRICKMTYEETCTCVKEDLSKLRLTRNYEGDVTLADIDKTGIKEACVFNQVNGFHLLDNVTVDAMHDILEGVCSYVMTSLLYTFVFTKKYFTVQYLNMQFQSFNYSPQDFNKPPLVSAQRLRNNEQLKMSASEMLCFVRYFGIIMGHKILKIDLHYTLYIYLRKIIDVVLSPRIVIADANRLSKYILKLNELYLKFYGNLKPKFHILIHYPRLLLMNGPIVNFWGMRFESNHKTIKSNAQSSNNTANLLKTIATKQVLRMTAMMHSLQYERDVTFSCEIKKKENYFFDNILKENCNFYKKVCVHGTIYSIGTFLVLGENEVGLEFGEIIDIIEQNVEIYFNLQLYSEIKFEEHFYAYVIDKINAKKVLRFRSLPNIAPVLGIRKCDIYYAVPPYML
ncbi:uncharacterized protein [Prorops nasuta]|uniref:uncharacterized protein n=1 Tax=Prorops nasuta TaxID=863751 RepID=UPI0034CDDDD2